MYGVKIQGRKYWTQSVPGLKKNKGRELEQAWLPRKVSGKQEESARKNTERSVLQRKE